MTIINSIDGINGHRFHSLDELKEYHNINDIQFDNMLSLSKDIEDFFVDL